MIKFRKCAAVLLTLFVFALPVFAQSSTGRLIGTVKDAQGAIVPGATVTIKDNQTGRERTVTATNEGTFTIPQVEFGTYTVTVTAQGFKTFTATDLKIAATQDYDLTATLEAGDVSANVTVVAGSDIVNSSNAQLSNTIDTRQVKELPINGRNPLALLNLLAGVNPTSSSINGQRSSSTNYTRDGLNVQDNFIRTGGFVSDRPTVDDTGEFTAVLQNAGAEFGGSQIVQLVTPRGGSHFSGAIYEFNRNSEFGANSFFNNLNGLPRPFLNRNQFGGTIAGPARLPRFGEGGPGWISKHAFFYANYEAFRQRSQASATGTTLLAPARNGTFSYVDNTGVTRTVNVLTGAGLTLTGTNLTTFNNAGGVLSLDPLVQNRLLANLPTTGNGITNGVNFTQQYNFNIQTPVDRDGFTGRFDVQINDRNAFNFVFKKNTENNARNDLAYGFQQRPFVFQGSDTKLFVLAYNWTPTSRLSNEVRGGYQRSEPFFNESGVPTDFTFSASQTQSQTNLAGIVTDPEGTFRAQGRNTDYWNLQDNANYSWGNHSFRFGGQLQTYKTESINFAGITPLYSFSSTSNPNTPGFNGALFPGGINSTDLARANNLRYFLAGIIGAASVGANLVDINTGFRLGAPQDRILKYKNWSFYGQDSWRLSPTFTLNYGLRYELFTPLNNPQQIYLEAGVQNNETAQQAALDPNGIYQIVGGNAGNPGDFFKTDKNNFGPVVSFAWSPNTGEKSFLSKFFPGNGKTVIRGGYRISYNSDEYERAPDNALLNHVGLGSQTVNALVNGSTQIRAVLTPRADMPAFAAVPGNFATPTVPKTPISYSTINAQQGFQGTVFVIDPNFQVPLTHEYNIGLQREFGSHVLEVRYVGSRSNQLVRSQDFNQVDIRNNGFLADFLRARNNCLLQGGGNILNCTNANFNPNIPGSQPLTVFPNLASGGLLTNATILGQIQQGVPADLAVTYIINGLTGTVPFLANPNTFVANVLRNGGLFRYNAMQIEVRRRFAKGYSYQVNYTFQKTLADSTQESQTNVDPYLDNANTKRNYGRPTYDRAHTVNANSIWELPFGKGRRWLRDGWASKVFGGFQLTNIVNISTGEPTSILDARGTLNRAGRSALQPATSTLSTSQIKQLIGVFKTPNGVYLINPSVLQATATCGGVPNTAINLTQTLPANCNPLSISTRGASPIGTAPFAGQVFFQNAPGSTGNLPMNFINGPLYVNWNSGFFRNFRFHEGKQNLQLRAEAFNVTNRANMFIGEGSGIFSVNSTTFGKITSSYAGRIIQFGARFDF